MVAPRIRFCKPATSLRPYISAYYFTDIDEGEPVHDLMHPEWANIRFTLSGYWTFVSAKTSADSASMPARLYGPTSRTTRVTGHPPTRTASAGILPLGWAHLIGLPAHQFADRIVDLKEAFPTDADRIWQALRGAPDDDGMCEIFNDFFGRLVRERPAPTRLLAQAHAALLDPAVRTVQDLSSALGRSSRQIARLCLQMFGFPPKLLLRRQRFLRTLAAIRANPGVRLSALLDTAYYDQSHFVRDFQDFMGMSPTAYFGAQSALLAPAGPLRQRVIGETLQGLHPVADGLRRAMSDSSKAKVAHSGTLRRGRPRGEGGA